MDVNHLLTIVTFRPMWIAAEAVPSTKAPGERPNASQSTCDSGHKHGIENAGLGSPRPARCDALAECDWSMAGVGLIAWLQIGHPRDPRRLR